MAWQKQPFTSLIHSWFNSRLTWSLRCALQSCRQPSFPRHLFINLSELTLWTLDPPMLVYSPLIPRHTPALPATHPQKFLRSENLLLWKISITISFLTHTRSDELLNSYIVLFAYSLQILLVSWKKHVWNFWSQVLSPLSKALFFHSWAWSRTKKNLTEWKQIFCPAAPWNPSDMSLHLFTSGPPPVSVFQPNVWISSSCPELFQSDWHQVSGLWPTFCNLEAFSPTTLSV